MKLSKIIEIEETDVKNIEKKLDKLFSDIRMDVEFTRHFIERVIQRDITEKELIDTFTKLHIKHGNNIKKDNFSGIIYDISNYLNIPIKVEYDKRENDFDLVNITILKTKDKPKTPHKDDKIINV